MGVSRRAVVTLSVTVGSTRAPRQLPHQLRVEQPHCRARSERRGDDATTDVDGHRLGRLADHCGSASPTDNAPEHRAAGTGGVDHRTARSPPPRPPPPVATSVRQRPSTDP